MSIRFNPLIFAGLDLAGGAAGAVEWKSPVADEASLPLVGNLPGDVRVTLDTQHIYVWNDTTSKWVEQNLTIQPVGATPNPNGAALNLVDDGNITRFEINLEPADATNPGVVSTAPQDFAGSKTFQDTLVALGQIDAQVGVDSTNGTLNLGVGMNSGDTINIGSSGINVNLYGSTFYQDVTNLQVTDKLITVNKDGAVASGFGSGIELEENSVITGYVKTSGDRNSWILKAPNTSGTVTLTPGAAGITLDESTSDLLPLSGVRAMTGALDVGFNNINNVSTIQGGAAPIIIESNGFRIKSGGQTYAEFDTSGSLGVITFSKDLSLGNNNLTNTASISLQSGISPYGSVTLSGSDLKIEAVADLRLEAASQIKAMAELSMESAKIVNLLPGTAGTDAVNKNQLDSVNSNFTVMNEPTGFVNRTDSEILFTNGGGTPTFTIQPKAPATSYDVYVKGVKFTKTVAATVTPVSHPGFPYAGNNYFYFDDTGAIQVTNTFTAAIIQQYAFISIVYWNVDTNSYTYFAEERHGLTMDGATHSYLHTVFGSRYLSGLALQGFTIGSGGSNADAQFTSDQGTIRDEDILLQIAAQSQIPILYRIGQNWRRKAADAYPVIYSGTAGYTGANGRLPYNEFTGGAWQLTQVANSAFVLVHFFATNDKDAGVVGIQGIQTYNSISSARLGANSEITSLSGLPFAEFVPIGSVIFESSNSFGNAIKARVLPTDTGANYVDFRGTQLYTPAGTATTHGLLSGLANDDHFQYLLVDGTRAMSGALNMGTHQINNVTNPTLAQDAATKNYVDTITTLPSLSLPGSQVTGNISGNSANVTGVVAIANGGTGQTTKSAAYNALSPITTVGDLIIGVGANSASRLPIGANNTYLTSNGITASWQTLPTTGITSLTGEVTASGPGSAVATISANAVTNSKLALMPANTIKGNNTGVGSNPIDLTTAQTTAMLDLFTSTLKGLTPASGGGTSTYLRADGTWAIPPGIGITSISVASANGLAGTSSGGATPSLTLSTTVTGVLKGNGTAISAALAGTDYVIPSGSITGTASNITATTNSTLTTLSALSLPGSQVSGNISGNAANVTGTVAIANGGTGQTTQQTAINALAGAVTSGQFLRGNGTNVLMAAIQAADVPTLNQNTTGSAGSVSGTNVITNSNLAQMPTNTIKGNNTGLSATPLDLTTAQVTAMLNQFTTSLQGLVPGSGGGTTNFLRADGTWAAPTATGVTSVSVATANGLAGTSSGGSTPTLTLSTTITGVLKGNGTSISAATAGTDYVIPSGSITGTASNVTGTVAIANGGTGQTTQQAAINALTGTQVSGTYLRSNGTNATLSSIQVADVPTLNQDTTGSSGSVVFTVTAGENLTAGDVVYISSGASDGGRTSERAYRVDAANITSPDTRIEFSGFVVSTVTAGNTATIRIAGELGGFAGLTVGAPVFASTSVVGGVQSAVPSVNGQWIIPVGTAKNATTITINGALSSTATKITGSAAGQFLNVVSVSSNTTLTNTNDVALVSGNTQITLPVPSIGKTLTIKKTDTAGTTTVIVPAGSETIDGLPSFSIAEQYRSISLTTNGTNWFII